MYKQDLEKAEEPEIKLKTSVGSWRKQGKSRKTSTSADYAKAFDSVDPNKLWKILKEIIIPDQPPYLAPEKPVCRSRSNS